MADVFFSYARADQVRVAPFVVRLEAAGLSVWWDRALDPGEDWADVIDAQLRRAGCVVVAFSEASVQSHWVHIEAHEARRRRILIPLLLDDVRLPDEFRGMQALDAASADDDTALHERLLRAVRAVTGKRRVRKRWVAAAVAAMVVLASVAGWLARVPADALPAPTVADDMAASVIDTNSVAVLRFRSGNADGSGQALADGVGLVLLDRLSQVPSLKVSSRVATWALPADASLDTLRQRLQVAWVVEGRLLREGEELVLTAELVETTTGFRAGSWRRSAAEDGLLNLQRDLAREVITALDANADAVAVESAVQFGDDVEGGAWRRYLLGEAVMRNDRSAAGPTIAEAQFLEALRIDEDFGAAWAGLCSVALARYAATYDPNELSAAETACAEAAERAPKDIHVALAQGRLELERSNPEAATAAYTRALLINAYSEQAHIGLADAYADLGRDLAARLQYEQAIADQPGSWEAREAFAKYLFRNGEMDAAARQSARALDLAPEDAVLLSNLGANLLSADNLTAAISFLTRSIDLQENAAALSNLGTAYYYSYRFDDAAQAYLRATALAPRDYRLWSNLGDAYTLLDDPRARDAYAEALSLSREQLQASPDDAALVVGVLALEAALQPGDVSSEQIESAVASTRSSWEAQYLAAMAYVRKGNRALGAEHMRESIELGFPLTMARRDPQLGPLLGAGDSGTLQGM